VHLSADVCATMVLSNAPTYVFVQLRAEEYILLVLNDIGPCIDGCTNWQLIRTWTRRILRAAQQGVVA
jgi:hypothetical protein